MDGRGDERVGGEKEEGEGTGKGDRILLPHRKIIPAPIYRVVQKSEATTFEGLDFACPHLQNARTCIQNITALK